MSAWLIIFFNLIFLSTAFAGELRLDNAAMKCFAMGSPCVEGEACANDASPKQSKCFEEIGLSKSGCIFFRDSVTCDVGSTEKFLQNTRGCRLTVSGYIPENEFSAWLWDEKSEDGECRFGPYLIGKSDELEKVDVHDAKKDKVGWTHELPRMSVGFEKVLDPKNTKIAQLGGSGKYESTSPPPWINYIEWNHNSRYLPCDDSWKTGTTESERKILRDFGYEDVESPVGKKHFGGDGRNDMSVVRRFSNLKEFKLCGRLIPVGTKISFARFDFDTCYAATPGAVPLLLSATLFPNAAGLPKGVETKVSVQCAPKAQKLSNYKNLIKEFQKTKKPIIVPKLDWQECDCKYFDFDAPIR